MKSIIIVLLMAILTTSLCAVIENPDKPLKGKWDFQMKKIWEVESAGDDVIGDVQNIRASKDGRVYIADSKNCKIFIFSKDGKYISAFGPKGEGPGEIRRYRSGDQLFVVNKSVIFADPDRIHYFTLDGKYEKSVIIPANLKPRAFVSEDIFVSAPGVIEPDPQGNKKAEIMLYSTKDQSKKIISEFQPYDKADATRESNGAQMTVRIVIHTITPMVFLDYGRGKVYYGMSNSYKISAAELNGKESFNFRLDGRKAKDVSTAYKKDLLDRLSKNAPKELVQQIIDGLPEKASFFQGIQIDKNGMIYAFVSEPGNETFLDIDIFSPKGKYLYHAEIRADKGFSIKVGEIYFWDDYVLIPAEDEEGNLKVIKYSIKLPVL